MSQLAIMFLAGEIKQKLLRKLREFFFVPPFIDTKTLFRHRDWIAKMGLYAEKSAVRRNRMQCLVLLIIHE